MDVCTMNTIHCRLYCVTSLINIPEKYFEKTCDVYPMPICYNSFVYNMAI